MDRVMIAVLGIGAALAAAVVGVAVSRAIAGRRPRAFWIAAVGLFVAGVAVAVAGGLLSQRAVLYAGLAFAIVSVTVLKWVSGHVPGVPARREP